MGPARRSNYLDHSPIGVFTNSVVLGFQGVSMKVNMMNAFNSGCLAGKKGVAASILRFIPAPVRNLLRAVTRRDRNPQPPKWQRDGKFQVRGYNSYDDYLLHQAKKLDRVLASGENNWLPKYDGEYREMLRTRLEADTLISHGMSVLCLAARLGTEVKSFQDLGCFAVGLDINTTRQNKYVLYGDFHEIQFPADSVDVVFTNSLDHVLKIDKVIGEILRVLKPNGLLIIEAVRGSGEGVDPGTHESFFWANVNDLIRLFEERSFRVIIRTTFEAPWIGEHMCLRKGKG